MKATLALIVATVAVACVTAPQAAPDVQQSGVATDVAYLASRALRGRATGTPGGDSAATYIARRYRQLGLRGAFRGSCRETSACDASYFQFFTFTEMTAQNVGAVVPGIDTALRDQYVVVGAHYDHLGESSARALDPAAGPAIRPGADDNASGTAAVLELARRLAARPARRSVIFVNFDAEEWGLVGSGVFVDHPPAPRHAMVLMVNLDMIGRLRRQQLIVDAPTSSAMIRALVDSAAAAVAVRTMWSPVTSERSDHASFRRVGIPAVALFTGYHGDYHRASDIAARIDLPGILKIVDVAEAIVRAAADRDTVF